MTAPMDGAARPAIVTPAGWLYAARVHHWTDGDTVVVDCLIDVGYEELVTKRRRIRLLGVNTPEENSRSASERQAAKLAQAEAERIAPPGTIVDVLVVRYDKYGGRDDGDVIVGAKITLADGVILDGTDVAEALLAGGYGVPYDGGKR